MSTFAHRCVGVVVGAIILCTALTACVGEPPKPPVTIVVTETATPTPTPKAPDAPPVDPPPAAPAPIVPNDPAKPAEPLPEGPAFDLGAMPGAQGPVTTDGLGNPLTYTVVSGDAFFEISQRFDIPQQQLLRMNPSVPGLGLDIYIGDVINLDWTTTK